MLEPFFRFSDVDSRLREFNPFRLLGKDVDESLRSASVLFSRRGVMLLLNKSALFSRVIIRICSSLLPPPVLLSLREGERDGTELFGFTNNDLFFPATPVEGVSCVLAVAFCLSLLLLLFLFEDALGNVEQRDARGVDGD